MSNEELAVAKQNAAALASFGDIEGVAELPKGIDPLDKTGTEGIGKDDLRVPRLTIAQGLSPQLIRGDSNFIPGLEMFDLFNDFTGEIYCHAEETLRFIPIYRDVVRIEFDPDDAKKVLDKHVPANDPRLEWEGDNPPRATEFTEFVILLLRPKKKPEMMVLSIKMTNKYQRRAAEKLSGYVKFQDGPIYAGFKTVKCHPEKFDSGTAGTFVFANAGFIPTETPVGKALFDYCAKEAENFAGKEIPVAREAGDDSFDTKEFEKGKRNPGM